MRKKQIIVIIAVTGALLLGSCSEGGDSGLSAPTITLPAPSAIPDYTAVSLPSNDEDARDVFYAAVAAIGDAFGTSPAPGKVSMKGIDLKSAVPKAVDSGDVEIGPITFTDDTDMIDGAKTSGSVYLRAKWYYKDEFAPFENEGDYDQNIIKMNLDVDLDPGVTADTRTIEGKFIFIIDMNLKEQVDRYVSGDDYKYTTRYAVSAGMGFAISVSNSAGMGGKFICSVSLATSGSFWETFYDEGGTYPVAGITATLYVYDNDDNLLRSIAADEEDIEDLFGVFLDL